MARTATLRNGERVTLYSETYIKERLVQACVTLRRLPMPRDGKPQGFGGFWPDTITDFWAMWNALDQAEKIERQREINRTRIKATPDQITEMDQALEWLNLVKDTKRRKIVFARALGIRPRELQSRMGISRRSVYYWEAHGLREITDRLNACTDCTKSL